MRVARHSGACAQAGWGAGSGKTASCVACSSASSRSLMAARPAWAEKEGARGRNFESSRQRGRPRGQTNCMSLQLALSKCCWTCLVVRQSVLIFHDHGESRGSETPPAHCGRTCTALLLPHRAPKGPATGRLIERTNQLPFWGAEKCGRAGLSVESLTCCAAPAPPPPHTSATSSRNEPAHHQGRGCARLHPPRDHQRGCGRRKSSRPLRQEHYLRTPALARLLLERLHWSPPAP